MTQRRNVRLMMAALFFSLCLVAGFALTPQPAEAGGTCWWCPGIDICEPTTFFGYTECDAIPLERCILSGNPCFPGRP